MTRPRRGAVAAVLLLLWLAAAKVLPNGMPPGIVLQGAVLGSLTALLAVGMVLAYRATRVVNFAQAELAAVAGIVTIHLAGQRGWPYLPSVLVGLALATGTGALVEVLVVRRLRAAPRLIVAVATIGAAQLLIGASVVLGLALAKDASLAALETPFSAQFSLRPVIFSSDHIAAMVMVPVVLAGLGFFLQRTRAGIAIRAAADNGDRAALLGVPTARLSTLVWSLCGLLSGLAVILRVPLSGLVSVGAVTGGGTSLLVRTLAAVVIARMENLPVAAGAAVGLGIFEAVAAWNLPNATLVDPVLVAVILVALLAQRGGFSRQEESALATTRFRAIREVRPIPEELKDLWEVRLAGRALRGVGLALALALPLLVPPSRQQLATVILIYAIVAVSLVVLTGWAGQVSLGQWALVGLGGTAVFALHTNHGLDFFLAVPVGMAVAATAGVVLGLPALRARGHLAAITTLAFALTAFTYIFQVRNLPWLVVEQAQRPVLWGRLGLEHDWQMYEFSLVAFVAVALAAGALRRSRAGRAMVAVRDNEAASAAVSISPLRVKLAAFAISGAMAGLAGALYVTYQHGLHADAFSPEVGLRVFSMVVIGGLGSLSGAVLGAFYVRGAEFFLPAGWSLLASGAGLLVLLLTLPGGLGEIVYRLRDAFLRRVALRRGLSPTPTPLERAGPAVPAARPGPGASVLLDVSGLRVAYDGVPVVFGVDLAVEEGEIVALLGTNGAGKSTVLRAVSGLVAPSEGTVVFAGETVSGMSPQAIARLGIAQVPGGRGVFPTLSVAENLRVAGWLRRQDPGLAADIEEVTDRFPVLANRADTPAGALSGGEQQMLSLAMAFLMRPRLLLIDELSLGLAPGVVEILVEWVRAVAEAGTTVVIVEQRVNTALRLARRAVFVEKGEIRFAGLTEDLLDRPDILHSVYLQGARVPATPAGGDPKRPYPAAEPGSGTRRVVVETRGLTKRYGGTYAVDGVDLSVSEGEIVGLIGPNGAGKTTLFDLVTGLARPDAGTVWLSGVDVSDWPADARARHVLGRSFQDTRLWPSLTVTDAIAVAFERHHRAPAAIPAMFGLPVSTDAEAAVREQTAALINDLGLRPFRDKFVAELSTGTRRIVEIATLLAHRPAILLLDEPGSGIAQKETEALVPLLRDLRAELGCTLVVIDHDTTLLARLTERLVALQQGRIIADGPPEAVLDEPDVLASFLGSGAR